MPRAAYLLLLLPVVAAAAPGRRRLGDALDMEHLRRLADEGQVGTELRFKLAAGTSAARAATVAAAVDCSSAKRVFRPAGKHEAKHRAAGLDRWWAVKCSGASNETWSKLDAFLAKGDASHDGVELVEPALVVKMSP